MKQWKSLVSHFAINVDWRLRWYVPSNVSMITPSNGNISRITGLLWGDALVTGGIPSQKPVTRNFDVFFDLCLNKLLSKQSRRRWFETQSCSLWRHFDGSGGHLLDNFNVVWVNFNDHALVLLIFNERHRLQATCTAEFNERHQPIQCAWNTLWKRTHPLACASSL